MSLVRIGNNTLVPTMSATLSPQPVSSSPQLPLVSLCETVSKINMPSVAQANITNSLKPLAPATCTMSVPPDQLFNLTISNGEIRPTTSNSTAHLGVATFAVSNLKDVVTTTGQKPIIVTVSSMPGIAGGKQLTSVTNVLTTPVLSAPFQMVAPHFTGDKLPSTSNIVTVPAVPRTAVGTSGSTLIAPATLPRTVVGTSGSPLIAPATLSAKPRSSAPHLAPLLPGSIKGVAHVPVMIANANSSLLTATTTSGGSSIGGISLSSSIVTVTPVLMTSSPPLVSFSTNSGMSLNHCAVSQAQVLPLVPSSVKSAVSSGVKSIGPTFKSVKQVAVAATPSFPVISQNGPTPDAVTNPKGDPTNPDYDPIQAMDWKDGIASLPGSNIRFRLNEFGTLEIVTDEVEKPSTVDVSASVEPLVAAVPEVHINNEVEMKDTSEDTKEKCKDDDASSKVAETNAADSTCEDKSEDICRCENCNCFGLKIEFCKSGRFCSQACVALYAKGKNSIIKKACKEMVSKEPVKKKKRKLSQSDSNDEASGCKEVKPDIESLEEEKKEMSDDSGDEFSWDEYLVEEKAVAAPVKLFNDLQTFPTYKNGFQVNMKLEGIDPKHPSLFCVLTVSEIRGFRIRLHFDGYSECYDFWTNADSPDIFPVGWCEKNNHKLQTPRGVTSQDFNWNSYLNLSKAIAAPEHLFNCKISEHPPTHSFQIGMKLEAVDKKNSSLVCVATVTDVMGNRFLIHFDGWEDIYDYWADPCSPHIHPVNWCQENGHVLTPPKDWKDPDTFSWDQYLSETRGISVPHRAFKQRSPHELKAGMKLEAVDKRNPVLIRVATVVDVTEHSILLHFDGWSNAYDYWVDDDSSDLHPINWCAKTGHPLEPPVDIESTTGQGGCPTPGCLGLGHIKGPKYTSHHSAFGCPYSQMNINKLENTLQDRVVLSKEAIAEMTRKLTEMSGATEGLRRCPTPGCNGSGHVKGKYSVHHRVSGCPIAEKNAMKAQQQEASPSTQTPNGPSTSSSSSRASSVSSEKCLDNIQNRNGIGRGKKKIGTGLRGRPPKALVLLRAQQAAEKKQQHQETPTESKVNPELVHKSVFEAPILTPSKDLPQHWEEHVKIIPGISSIKGSAVKKWSAENVANFISSLKGCEDLAPLFRDESIDGESFLLMDQMDIINILRVKLGPALKIYNCILSFRSTEND